MTDLSGQDSPSSEMPFEVPRPTVLVVEDEAILRLAIRRLLEEEGYSVLLAEHGGVALEVLREREQRRVDLVLTDLPMPVVDGRQLAAAMARLYPKMPIVFMSGFTTQFLDLRRVSPHLDFLAKPFKNDDLLNMVRRHIHPRT